jgi:hypothetical protein
MTTELGKNGPSTSLVEEIVGSHRFLKIDVGADDDHTGVVQIRALTLEDSGADMPDARLRSTGLKGSRRKKAA